MSNVRIIAVHREFVSPPYLLTFRNQNDEIVEQKPAASDYRVHVKGTVDGVETYATAWQSHLNTLPGVEAQRAYLRELLADSLPAREEVQELLD